MSNLSSRQRSILLWLGFSIVLVVAAFFRLWQLHTIPPGLFGDEAANALDALDVLEGRGQVFFPHNYGREGLHMWILAGIFKLMDVTPYAIRLPSTIAGVITALAAYWLGYEMWIAPLPTNSDTRLWLSNWLIALSAGLFTAISYWHIHFSRFGIRLVFTTAMAALTMASLWRAINTDHRRWWALSGLFMGLGAYFYIASRFIPLLVGLFLGGWLLLSWLRMKPEPVITNAKRFIIHGAILFAVAALTFAPLGHYFLTHPGSFTQRSSEVSVFKNGLDAHAMQIIGRNIVLDLLQFIWPGHGDVEQFYNLPGRALFSPLTALLALCGFGISFKRWRQMKYGFLLLWFFVMASPAFMVADRAPTMSRMLGVIPGVFFFPAIGLETALAWLGERLTSLTSRRKAVLLGSLAILAFILPAAHTYRDYFLRWGPSDATADIFETDMTTAWRWLETHPAKGPLYVSADIYMHLSFILPYEQVPTTQYFTRRDPNLHWFDARRSWPLPKPQSKTTIIVGNSAMPPDFIQNLLHLKLTPIGKGAAYLAKTGVYIDKQADVWFNTQLGLVEQVVIPPTGDETMGVILQIWRTQGPLFEELAPYQIQSALLGLDGKQLVQVTDEIGMRPPEWEVDGAFVTWQHIPWPQDADITGTVLRVVPNDRPPLQPKNSTDGWVQRPLRTWGTIITP